MTPKVREGNESAQTPARKPGRTLAAKVVPAIAVVTGALSAVSWTYRFADEFVRYNEVLFYVLVPTVTWGLFAGPLFLSRSRKRFIRIIAAILLVPATLLWALSVQVGFYGLRIH